MPGQPPPGINHAVQNRVVATTVVALCEKIAVAIERRGTRTALNKLDDYMLKDMGIVRTDIERIAMPATLKGRSG
ncbi:MAG TPA: DUF1127 domain-containing protein [Aestuariivirga sp.]|jgi:uncharacterized protein YjiS (DUF1127 family)|nr:DUF1127 domain-containing protein [Aestuariivirga sp.]